MGTTHSVVFRQSPYSHITMHTTVLLLAASLAAVSGLSCFCGTEPCQTTGTCAAGLRCLRQCECKTSTKKACVFPFTYKGETHNACSSADSENGAVWCATEVDEEGEVVRNTWEDCEEGCPGTSFECNEGFLFNVDGKCVNGTDAPALLRFLKQSPLAVTLDDQPDEFSQKEAPLCPIGKT